MVKRKHIFLTLVAVIISLPVAGHSQAKKKKGYVDPNAIRILKSMSDFLSGLDQFSCNIVNMREDITRSGHRIDYEVGAQITVDRPNRMKSIRQGHLVDQEVYYDGKTITIYSPRKKIYSLVDAPDTMDAALRFAREKLGIGFPVADLMYSDTFPLLTKGVISASVIGKEMIAGFRCDHLLFTLPGVDFQIWVPDRGDPLPFKYIVTDTGTRQLLSIVAVINSWNLSPRIEDGDFDFTPPDGARVIPFLTVDGKTIVPKTK